VNGLTSAVTDFASGPWTAAADVQRDLVTEGHGLEVAAVMHTLSGVARRARLVSDLVADLVS
jgi:hypothetical protein